MTITLKYQQVLFVIFCDLGQFKWRIAENIDWEPNNINNIFIIFNNSFTIILKSYLLFIY